MADAARGDLKDLRDHVLICGWSPNVSLVLEGLLAAGALAGRAVVLVNQADEADVKELREHFVGVDIRHVIGPYQPYQS